MSVKKKARDKRVDFVVAGAQKCGTTALFHYMRTHKNINIPDAKELHYFDKDNLDWENPSHEAYHSRFDGLPEATLWGDVTPIYLYWPEAHRRMFDYNPDLKIIVFLRNPSDRAFSQWRMELDKGRDVLPFEIAIRDGRKRLALDTQHPGQHRVYSYVERGFYAAQLDRILRYFPREQLLILNSDFLLNDHKRTLWTITEFLNVEGFKTYPDAEIVHSRKGDIPRKDKQYLDEVYKQDLLRLKDEYGFSF